MEASDISELTLRKVNDFVDDDLLSCFLWAAGENAVATPGWEVRGARAHRIPASLNQLR